MRYYYPSMAYLFILLANACLVFADNGLIKRKEVQIFVKQMVKEYQFKQNDLLKVLANVQLQPHVIESMDKPYEKKNWDVYRDIFLTKDRLESGIHYWMNNKKTLSIAERQYGVPAEVIVAILGVETLYGTRQGDNRILDALATLAFNYPKRARYFTHELKEYLLLCREHQINPAIYKGSYAGAIGQPQFMPSSYRNYAIDFYQKGKRDLINDNNDSIASIANYFHEHGWKTNADVVQKASLSGSKYKQLIINPRATNYTLKQLSAHGIRPNSPSLTHPLHAALMEFTTSKGYEYWLAYPNFFVITRYNSSPQYALVVYLLSQQLKQKWIAMTVKNTRAPV